MRVYKEFTFPVLEEWNKIKFSRCQAILSCQINALFKFRTQSSGNRFCFALFLFEVKNKVGKPLLGFKKRDQELLYGSYFCISFLSL